MDKFLSRNTRALPPSEPAQPSEYIEVKFESAVTRDGKAGIGYTVLIEDKKYQGYRYIGKWDYNEALALSLLDALESLDKFKHMKLRLKHRGCRFQLFFHGVGEQPTQDFRGIMIEVRKALTSFRAMTIKLVDKSELNLERKIAQRASRTPHLDMRSIELISN